MNILSGVRDRIGGVVAATVVAVLFLACGALFAFVIAPRQAFQAKRIENMPLMDATAVQAAAVGDDLLVTGYLADNAALDEHGFVAYRLDEWIVTAADANDPDDDPEGNWQMLETHIPALTLDVENASVRTLGNDQASLSGPVHEEIVRSESSETAYYANEWLPNSSRRYRGFYNGDLITVMGKKGSTSDVLPEEMFAGDRVAFVEAEHQTAQGLLYGGICMMLCAPLIMVIAGLVILFGRRRR